MHLKLAICTSVLHSQYCYYAAFNVPCVVHNKNEESQARYQYDGLVLVLYL